MLPTRRLAWWWVLGVALAAGTAEAEDHTVTVDAAADAGTLPTWFEPSAFIYWAPAQLTDDLIADAVTTRGVVGLATQLELGGASSVEDYVARLDASSLPTSVQTAANAGMQVIIQIQATPRWMSSVPVDTRPPNCAEEWPTYQTVAPAADKWADWEAVVFETVKYFNVTHGFTNVWYQLWEEPDGPCYWTDTQANYLELWKHTVAGARRADPTARLGGPGVAGGVNSIKPGETVPMVQAFLAYAAAQGLPPDFVSFHIFDSPPETGLFATRQAAAWLGAEGLPDVPILISSWNPNDAVQPNSAWPVPPSALSTWQPDTEMGASFALSLMEFLHQGHATGYQCMYALDDADVGSEFPHEWGMRTNANRHRLRKALYHAQVLVGHLPRALVRSTVSSSNSADEHFEHFFVRAGAEGDRLSVLLWNHVTAPGRTAMLTLQDLGYGPADLARFGSDRLLQFAAGQLTAADLTGVPQEQADLDTARKAFLRQSALVTETQTVQLALSGLDAPEGYQLTRTLIDATHNNAYQHFVHGGLSEALGHQTLETLDSRHIATLSEVEPIELNPYSVMLVEIVRGRSWVEPPPKRGCHCSGVEGAPLLFLTLALLRRRRTPRG